MNSSKLTNVLLSVIAVFLLVVVVQNSKRSTHPEPEFPNEGPPEAGMPSEGHPPMGEAQPPMGMPGQDVSEFHPSSMVIGSLACPNDASLTLSDPNCNGKEADKRRRTVEEAMAKNMSVSKVYDLVVERFGEKALTDSALQIRKGRRTAAKPE